MQCCIKLVDTKIIHDLLRLIVKRSGKNTFSSDRYCAVDEAGATMREIHTVSFEMRLHMCMFLEQSVNILARFGELLVET